MKLTYETLEKYIEYEPSAVVIATGEHIVMCNHDECGVDCEDDFGAVFYKHCELEYGDDMSDYDDLNKLGKK